MQMVFFSVTVSYLAFLVFCEGMGSLRLILSKSFLAFLKPLIHLQTRSWGAVLSYTPSTSRLLQSEASVLLDCFCHFWTTFPSSFKIPSYTEMQDIWLYSQMIPQHRCLLLSFVNFLVLLHSLNTLSNCLLYSLPPLLQDHHGLPEPQGQALTQQGRSSRTLPSHPHWSFPAFLSSNHPHRSLDCITSNCNWKWWL